MTKQIQDLTEKLETNTRIVDELKAENVNLNKDLEERNKSLENSEASVKHLTSVSGRMVAHHSNSIKLL